MFSVVTAQGMVAGKVKQDDIDAVKMKNYLSTIQFKFYKVFIKGDNKKS